LATWRAPSRPRATGTDSRSASRPSSIPAVRPGREGNAGGCRRVGRRCLGPDGPQVDGAIEAQLECFGCPRKKGLSLCPRFSQGCASRGERALVTPSTPPVSATSRRIFLPKERSKTERGLLADLGNSIASASIYCQAIKGVRWMPRRWEPTKDVAGCDKPRGGAKQPLIRGCPNGETRQRSCAVTQV
jgi:hypothetical protein